MACFLREGSVTGKASIHGSKVRERLVAAFSDERKTPSRGNRMVQGNAVSLMAERLSAKVRKPPYAIKGTRSGVSGGESPRLNSIAR